MPVPVPASDAGLRTLSSRLGEVLLEQGLMLACAESCTGGWVAKSLTDIAGSSCWFERGFVTYTNQSKTDMLGVASSLLETEGAVSEMVVRAMAEGALSRSLADLSLAISGIAGPGGGSDDKPVGLVWFAWSRTGISGNVEAVSRQQVFSGDRESVRRQAVAYALQGVLSILNVAH
ncbi:Nicotinamide-nucleotide amidase [hydrothermal vent metagenome]|uniref:Nicotinamide-nucleotide amidase n=1 Tax=hydrothermal vent metagenome TaxID=652676 RepID=A0A3B1BBR5_9ZZZZ